MTEVEIPDVDPADFACLMEYAYQDKAQLTSDNVSRVLTAARKCIRGGKLRCRGFLLDIACLRADVFEGFAEICLEFMRKRITSVTACKYLSSEDSKHLNVVDFIAKNFVAVSLGDGALRSLPSTS